MPLIFHCTTNQQWRAALSQGAYAAPTLAAEGFIHFSTAQQLLPVVNNLFRGQRDLVLLCVDSERLIADLRYENSEGGATRFPHVYGRVNLDAVVQVVDFPPQPDGTFRLPPELATPHTAPPQSLHRG